MKEIQPQNNFFVPNVPPLGETSIKLSGGKKEPFYYSLGVDSTIPFVSLVGGGATQKIFSWGEMIEVLPGQNVLVQNASFMLGDIQINSGKDYSAKPERVSVVVNTQETPINIAGIDFIQIRGRFPADTRRCRRAFLKYQITAGLQPISVVLRGIPRKHSFPGIDSFTLQQTYTEIFLIPAFTQSGECPLGYGNANLTTSPMGLTDRCDFFITYETLNPPAFINSLFMYVLEY